MPSTHAYDHLPGSLCCLSGDYLPQRDATVNVLDRGFIFGDGVYEQQESNKGSIMTTPDSSRQESLIEFPSAFPIKVMGAKVDGFVEAITHIARTFDPGFDAATVELRPSSGGKYLGVTITVTATSREQLDELYRTLSTHPMVKVVL